MYTSLKTCPDNLLLFMHHEPYTYRLHTGKTVIQTIYDDHYEGARRSGRTGAAVEDARRAHRSRSATKRRWSCWNIRPATPSCGATRSTAGSRRCPASPTTNSRIDHDPNRITASQMQLDGYTPVDVTPWETAPDGKAYVCTRRSRRVPQPRT